MYTLRPYQENAIQRLRDFIVGGKRKLVLVAPTGSGKTVIAASMIHGVVARGRRAVFLVHRRELTNQSVNKLTDLSVRTSVVMASDKRFDDYLPVQVCTIQTLARRLDRLPPADVVFVDECHHCVSASWAKVLAAYPEAIIVGLTATPWRMDKRGLADYFDDVVVAATPRELIANGSLVNYEAFAYNAPDLHKVRLVAGEFNQKDLELACNTKLLVGDVVREYLNHDTAGRRGLLFPVSIAHSKALVEEFNNAGVEAAHLDCYTKNHERDRILADLETGKVTIVSSVGVLTEGFDSPAAEVCILARPTQSLSLHLQMCGRVLRPNPGKRVATYHDHAGNFLRHGLPDDDRDYSLTNTPKRVTALHTCPFCQFLWSKLKDGKCPNCGELLEEPETREAGVRADIENVEGDRIDMHEIKMLRLRHGSLGYDVTLTDEQLLKAKRATRLEKAAEYLRLCEEARWRKFNNPKGWVAHNYRKQFGVWPQFSDAELQGVVPSVRPFINIRSKSA